MKLTLAIFFTTTSLLLLGAFSKTAEEWKSRSVYQLLTDRFARTNGDETPCDNLNDYCGGTFKGIQNNLDYIQGMGFDAIWISPIVANTPGGYHGYWTSNLYEINENFGTADELKELIRVCHERDIWVMVDIVANHMGYVDNFNYSTIVPFSDPSHYNIYKDCAEVDPSDQPSMELCWLSGLPDLDQNNPFVRETFMAWTSDIVKTYNIDALRIDTVPYVTKEFWAEFSQAAGVYTIGEVLSYDLPYVAGYQGSMDALLNYALYSTLRFTFQDGGAMSSLESYYDGAVATWADITVLGNFVNNHDNPRFLHNNGNIQGFKAALAFTICSVGIPRVYYGDEHAYGGGPDPTNRETLWPNMNTDSDIYDFLKTLNGLRKESQFYKHEQIQRFGDDSFYAFTRGEYFFAFTNSYDYQSRTISYHPYSDGTLLCNIFHKDDCVEVRNGEFNTILINGEVKILAPRLGEREENPHAERNWRDLMSAWAVSSIFTAMTAQSL
jgi:alpha-amylase